MVDDVYIRLREFLDNLPGGYPTTDSGVEIKILKKLFTRDEAEMAMRLNLIPEPAVTIAERCGMEEKEAAERLESMARQGLIYRARVRDEALYMPIQFVVGIYEFHLNSIDRELAEFFEEYLPYLGEVWKSVETKQLRVIPVDASVDKTTTAVATYDMVRDLVKKHDHIAVAPCICRKEKGLLGSECDRPHETCFSFGYAAKYYVENGMGREISAEEALKVIELAEESGLVLLPTNAQDIVNMCCCCRCCCGVLRLLNMMNRPADEVQSSFQARIDQELCAACGTCMERCQFEAIKEDDEFMEVDLTRCIGCGLCVPTCSQEAISLVEKSDVASPPANIVDMMMRISRDRGLV